MTSEFGVGLLECVGASCSLISIRHTSGLGARGAPGLLIAANAFNIFMMMRERYSFGMLKTFTTSFPIGYFSGLLSILRMLISAFK